MGNGIGLASLGSGITESFFGGLLKDRQDEKERKDKELVRQLAAYHALLEHPDTPESEIPNIMDAQAKLLKAEKETKPITDHMRQVMRRQVPYGPERETLKSRVDRLAARTVPSEPTTSALATLPGSPGSSSAPTTVTTPALISVPPEPVTYQPTTEYGTLTQGEASDLRKTNVYGAQQEAQLRRQLAIQNEVEEGRAAREAERTKRAKELETMKQEGRIKGIRETYEQKGKLLGPAAQAKMEAERIVYRNSLMRGPNAMDENQAEAASLQMFRAQVDTKLAAKKQQIEESKAQMARMGVLNAKTWEEVRTSKNNRAGLGAGMSAGVKREFDLRTRTLQDQLTSVFRQLEAAYKEAEGAPDAAQQANIERLEAEKADLWVSIDNVRNELLTRGASQTPSAPVVRPKSDPLNLFP
jgi:hypothetical protein